MTGEGFVTLKWEPVKTRFPAKYIVTRSTPLGSVQKVKETVETSWTDDAITTLAGENLLRVMSAVEAVSVKLRRTVPASGATIAGLDRDTPGAAPAR